MTLLNSLAIPSIMKKATIAILIFSIFSSCKEKEELEMRSIIIEKKIVLKEDGPEEFFYWEFEDSDRLFNNKLDENSALELYKDTLELVLGNEKYANAIKNESVQNLDKTTLDSAENGDRYNALLVHTGSVGKIREINYLESKMLNYQINKCPLFSKPTEFHGFIARNDIEGKLRAYFGSSDTEWPPRPSVIIDELLKEENKDWKLIRHLHNHYCKEDKDYIGILAPSLADAQYYKMLKERFNLEMALITNGIHTVEIKSEDFEKFESH